MFAEEARLASFSGAASSSKKKQSKADSNAWPHPTTGRAAKTSGIPLPAALAKYGFFHSPTEDAPDTVTHFLYPDLELADWKSGDDPLDKLDAALPGNGWCKMFWSLDQATQQGTSWVWKRADLLPTSEELTEARKATFGTRWPYDGKKGWKPTSKKLAEAGFYFTPTDEEEDSATCIYCKKSLGGWEKGDDPTHEHQKRKPDCPFFNCSLAAEPAQETQASPVEEEVDEGIQMPKRGKRAVSTARKPSARAPKNKAAAEPEPSAPEMDDEVVPEPEEESRPPPRSMRAASRRATKAIEMINSDTDINRIPRKGEEQRPTQHAATDPVPFPSSETDYGPLSDPIGVAASKPKRSRSKNKKLDETVRESTPQLEAEMTVIEHQDEEGNESVQDNVEEVEEPKRRGRGRATKAATLESVPTAPPPATRTRKVSKKVLPTSEPEPVVKDDVEDVVEVPPVPEDLPPASKTSKAISGAAAKGKKSKANSKSASRRATTVVGAEVEEEPETKESEPLSDAVAGEIDSELATAASQATIRASDEDRAGRTSTAPTSRAPFTQLSQLDTLQLDDKQRSMTLGLWLQYKADAAAQEMRQTGLAQLQDLENQMQAGRVAVERALRGEQS